jgi:phosphonate transport system substrate-binding protein
MTRKAVSIQRRCREPGVRIARILAIVGAVILGPWPTPVTASGAPPGGYVFGVFPYLPVLTLDRVFSPIVVDAATALGDEVHLRTKSTFEQFLEELASEKYDFAFLHPYFYVTAADHYNYLPLVRLNAPLTAVILVRQDSAIHSLGDLERRVLGLPPRLAAVTEVVEATLRRSGLVPGSAIEVHYFASKMSCLHAVAVGSADACGLPRFALSQLPSEEAEGLRVIYETAPIPNVVIAAHRRVVEADRQKLKNRILEWPTTDEGREILANPHWPGFVEALDQDYDEIRRHRAGSHDQAARAGDHAP